MGLSESVQDHLHHYIQLHMPALKCGAANALQAFTPQCKLSTLVVVFVLRYTPRDHRRFLIVNFGLQAKAAFDEKVWATLASQLPLTHNPRVNMVFAVEGMACLHQAIEYSENEQVAGSYNAALVQYVRAINSGSVFIPDEKGNLRRGLLNDKIIVTA